jgi:PAS domain S-box-containing protein
MFQLLVDCVVDYAIFLLSPDGRVASWNAGAARLKGYTTDEIIGRRFDCFYTPEARAAGRPDQLLAAARADGRVEDEGWRVRKDGSYFWADVVITALTDEDGQLLGFAKVTRDLTERRQAEQERAIRLAAERAAERLARLQVATAALAGANRARTAAQVLANEGANALGAGAAVVAFPSPDGELLQVAYAHGYDRREFATDETFAPDTPYPLTRSWQTGKSIFVGSRAHAQTDFPGFLRRVANSPFMAWATVPLVVEQRVLGVLGLSFNEPQTFGDDQRGFLLALAEVGAQALDRASLYEAERRARAEAEEAVRTQDEFLSIASHELRTPVAAVKATAQLAQRSIERGTLDPARMTRHLESIAHTADRLGGLIEDLLDLSRLRTGQLQLRRQMLELDPLLKEIVARYAATEPGHQFRLDLTDGCVVVHADPLRLEQVLDNLLSNAVKYSPAGGEIVVGVHLDGGGVILTVTDHGIGLPPGQEGRIFETFRRASNAAAQQIPGLGLGLPICRQLVELHGGRIWASSPGEDQGTTIRAWLPGLDVEAVESVRVGA